MILIYQWGPYWVYTVEGNVVLVLGPSESRGAVKGKG